LPSCRVSTGLALVCAVLLAGATAGCSGAGDMFSKKSDSGLFSKPLDVFGKAEWGSSAVDSTVNLGPSGPVPPEELVSADGRCAPVASAEAPPAPAQSAPPPAPAADRPVGSMAGDLAGAPMPAASPASLQPAPGSGLEPAAPPVLGGIALGMSECQAVNRAGLPSNVVIGADDRSQRRVVLTYLGGTWPGIYTFSAGRLKEIVQAPEQPKPVKPVKKKPAKKKPKTAQRGSTATVQ